MSLIIDCYHHYSNRVWILVEIEMENWKKEIHLILF